MAGSDEQKVADLFRSYMDQEKRDSLGITPIASVLADVEAVTNKAELMAFFGQYQSVGVTSPLYLWIDVDAKDSSRYATHVWQGGLALPDKDYYFNDAERFIKLRAGYQAHIVKMFDLAGFENGEQAANTILALETKMANFHWTRVQTRDSEKRYNKFDTANLAEVSSDIDWTGVLNSARHSNAKGLNRQSA